jgi:hypothetical protein
VDGVAVPVLAEWQVRTDPIRATIMGGKGMFQGVLEWDFEIPEGVGSVSLYTPRSMQTTEWREDLAIEVFDAAGAVVTRMIVYEDETPLGTMAPGKYSFRILVPSLGKGALEAHYAGAELRLSRSLPGIKLYPSLQGAFDGHGASGRLTIPFQGARTLFAVMPELDALDTGSYYYGSVKVKSGSDTVADVPLQVFRPAVAAAPVASLAAADEAEQGPATEETPASAAAEETPESAWAEAKASGAEQPVQWITAARDWQDAEPLDYRAELAVYEALVAAGLPEQARRQAVGFLKRFPNRADEFRDAARSWN